MKKTDRFRLTRAFLTIMILGFMFTCGKVHAAFIINIDAKANNADNPVVVYLDAGTYNVLPIGTMSGGAYNAWNPWGIIALPDKGWINQYTINSSQWSTHKFAGTSIKYATDLEALSYAVGLTFTLAADGEVLFYLSDTYLTDNIGGMSLLVTKPGNEQPVANAGDNIAITSETLASTTVNGTATDLDGDSLTYRWREGTVTLLNWQPVGPQGQAILNLGSIPQFTIGEHTLTLEVSDGELTSTDDIIITVDNSAPHAAPIGDGTYDLEDLINLGGQVSDFDGDMLIYQWLDGTQVLFSGAIQSISGGTPISIPAYSPTGLTIGTHTITLVVNDGINQSVTNSVRVIITDNQAPKLAPVPDNTILWPPDHRMVLITIDANATDNSGLGVNLGVQVSSNEPQEGLGDGDTPVDWIVQDVNSDTGIILVQLRAERSGSGKGREYSIAVSATDTSGNTSFSTIKIIVPHNKPK